MSRQGKWESLKAIHARYCRASQAEKQRILDEFCQITGYHRAGAHPSGDAGPPTYGPRVIQVLAAIWRAAGYP